MKLLSWGLGKQPLKAKKPREVLRRGPTASQSSATSHPGSQGSTPSSPLPRLLSPPEVHILRKPILLARGHTARQWPQYPLITTVRP